MKDLILIFILLVAAVIDSNGQPSGGYTPLKNSWDTIRPLENPGKGWYHHLLDNGTGKYAVEEDSVLYAFPGMDHLYLRLAWAYLEPEEGKYNWSYIDDVVNKYVPLGYGISFRITCKETGPAPGSVPREVDGVRYATPYWVKAAGAKGIDRPEHGTPSWTPYWNDPVFLEKLDNFHRAFAAKYGNEPWVRYIDVGSIGEWGEGHTHFSTRIPPSVEEVKTHMDIYLRHYKNTLLVVTDDLLYWNKQEGEVQELFDYAVKNGFTLRDDSPLVDWYVDHNADTWSVSHPHFFENMFLSKPVVFELEHYSHVKSNGNWKGKNGKDPISGDDISGADFFRNAMQIIRPTYIGYHGYAEEWLEDNPQLTNELLNLCGYWYFPVAYKVIKADKRILEFGVQWLNRGVAPAYGTFAIRGKLIPLNGSNTASEFEVPDSGNRHWLPGRIKENNYRILLSDLPKGKYKLGIQLYDKESGRVVDTGVKKEWTEGGYFILDTLQL